MFHPIVRMALVIASFAMGLLSFQSSKGQAWLFLIAGLLLAVGHFRHGPIWLAFRKARAGKYEAAQRLLATIKRPAWLAKQSRAYFYFLRGSMRLEGGSPTAAQEDLTQAFSLGLRTENDRCIALALLARATARNGERRRATELVEQARLIAKRDETGKLVEHVSGEIREALGTAT